MSVALLPTPGPLRHPLATRRAWVVGYAVETVEVAAEEERGWARDAAWDAKRLEAPRPGVAREHALRVPPPLEAHFVPGAEAWHQAGMPLPTSAFLAMRDATRHLR